MQRRSMRFALLAVALTATIVAVALVRNARTPRIYAFDGRTMGSTWSARVVGPADLDTAATRAAIEGKLAELDDALSNYRETAELYRFNHAPVGEPFAISTHLANVIRFGLELNRDSDGAFDPTVKPLVDLWGFGAAPPRTSLPRDDEIAAARARLGSAALIFAADGTALTRAADVNVDVDAIGPGYAADVVAALLTARKLPDHLVEIGGEVHVDGRRPDGSAWRVGIELPERARTGFQAVVALAAGGLSTSGDYRDYFEIDGKRYSHTLDPSTGRPVEHALTSVTVIADDTLEADGYATAVMVMGPERGMAWADAHGLPVYMLVRQADGTTAVKCNDRFAPFLRAQ